MTLLFIFQNSGNKCPTIQNWLDKQWDSYREEYNMVVKKKIMLIQGILKVKVAQSYLILCDPINYTVHGILQARILEWIAFPFSRRSSQGFPHCRWILYQMSHQGSPRILEWEAYPFSRGSS